MIFAWWLLLPITLILQMALEAWRDFKFFGVVPDLTALFVVLAAIRRGPTVGVWMGFISGLVLDVMNPEWLGVTSLSLALAGYLAGVGMMQVLHPNRLTQCIVVLLALLVFGLLQSVIGSWLFNDLSYAIVTENLFRFFMNLVFGLFVVILLPERSIDARS